MLVGWREHSTPRRFAHVATQHSPCCHIELSTRILLHVFEMLNLQHLLRQQDYVSSAFHSCSQCLFSIVEAIQCIRAMWSAIGFAERCWRALGLSCLRIGPIIGGNRPRKTNGKDVSHLLPLQETVSMLRKAQEIRSSVQEAGTGAPAPVRTQPTL